MGFHLNRDYYFYPINNTHYDCFNLIKNGYDTYSMSLQGVFGWGSVIFCAVVAIVLSKMKDR